MHTDEINAHVSGTSRLCPLKTWQMMCSQRKRSELCPKVREVFVPSNRGVVSHWMEWFGGHLKEDKAIYTSVQVMHQGLGLFIFESNKQRQGI